MLEATLAGAFGLLIGSFLNVCIYRLPRDLSVVHPRSHCVSCDAPIAWFDNIPLASYAILGGKCRSCSASIPLRYPLVEAIVGVLFFLAILCWGATAEGAKFCAFAAILVTLAFTDFEERILPDEFTLGGVLAGLAFSLVVPITDAIAPILLGESVSPRLANVLESAGGALLLSATLYGIGALYFRLRGREGLGFGDVKMVAAIGAFLGLQGALFAVIAGSVLGSICGLVYIRVASKDPATYELPFGSFLAAGGLIASAQAAWLLRASS